MKKILIPVALALACAVAQAQWVVIAESDKIKLLVNPTKVVVESNRVVATVQHQDIADDSTKVMHMAVNIHDCRAGEGLLHIRELGGTAFTVPFVDAGASVGSRMAGFLCTSGERVWGRRSNQGGQL